MNFCFLMGKTPCRQNSGSVLPGLQIFLQIWTNFAKSRIFEEFEGNDRNMKILLMLFFSNFAQISQGKIIFQI